MTGRVLSVTDEQASAWRDDGSEGGVLRTEMASGRLVLQPFLQGNVNYSQLGTGSVSFNGTGKLGAARGMLMYVNVNASPSLNAGVSVNFWFHGPLFGLAYNTSNRGVMGCRIDGISYPVPLPGEVERDTQNIATSVDYLSSVVVATDLGPGPHYCELDFPCDPAGVTQYSWYMHGYLVDAAAGYEPMPPACRAGDTALALTTTATALTSLSSGNKNIIAPVSLIFVNSTASAVTVSMLPFTVSGAVAVPINVPANGYAQWTPDPSGRMFTDWSGWKASASVNSAITAIVIGAV